jgi:hypothetical protein
VTLRWQTVVVDCHEPGLVAEFWSLVLGLPLHGPEADEWWLEPGGGSPDLLFQSVPEPKTVKNRLHLDLRADDQEAEVRRLEALGARRIDIGQGDVTWVVMADPEDNEFCVLCPRNA